MSSGTGTNPVTMVSSVVVMGEYICNGASRPSNVAVRLNKSNQTCAFSCALPEELPPEKDRLMWSIECVRKRPFSTISVLLSCRATWWLVYCTQIAVFDLGFHARQSGTHPHTHTHECTRAYARNEYVNSPKVDRNGVPSRFHGNNRLPTHSRG